MSNKHTGWLPEKNSLTNTKVGRLSIYERVVAPLASEVNLRAKWAVFYRCICECGTEKIIAKDSLLSQRTQSCGCLQIEKTHDRHTHYNDLYPIEYHAWKSMRQRCTNPNEKEYPRYGGRGISMDPTWEDFLVFYADVGPRPEKGYSLDRIDVDGNYNKENCRWATAKTQANNRRNNRRFTHDGRTLTVSEWARELGIEPTTLFRRLQRGTTFEKIMEKPKGLWR